MPVHPSLAALGGASDPFPNLEKILRRLEGVLEERATRFTEQTSLFLFLSFVTRTVNAFGKGVRAQLSNCVLQGVGNFPFSAIPPSGRRNKLPRGRAKLKLNINDRPPFPLPPLFLFSSSEHFWTTACQRIILWQGAAHEGNSRWISDDAGRLESRARANFSRERYSKKRANIIQIPRVKRWKAARECPRVFRWNSDFASRKRVRATVMKLSSIKRASKFLRREKVDF